MHRRFSAAPTRFLQWPFRYRSEDALIHCLRVGDSQAWQRLVEQWSPRLYSYLVYNTHSELDAQQLLQKVFSSTLQILLTESEQVNLTAIIAGSAYRHVLDYQQTQGAPHYSENNWDVDRTQQEQLFHLRLIQLPATVRHILLLRFLIGLNVWELVLATGYSRQMLASMLYNTSTHFEPISTL
jgi:DNA-directed RNA polymerase specialized sigma24 family protein